MKRSHRIMVSLTEEEHRALRKAAGSKRVSTYVYELIRRALARRPKGK